MFTAIHFEQICRNVSAVINCKKTNILWGLMKNFQSWHVIIIHTSGASTNVCRNFLIGCPLLESSPMTWTTTPSLRVAWASTWRIFVWHSLNCRDITFLCISYRWGKQMLVNIFRIWMFSQVIHKQMTNINTYSLPIDCFWKLSIRIQTTMDIGWVSSIKSELCEFWIILIFR